MLSRSSCLRVLTAVLLLGSVLGAGAAYAQTVERDGENATAIRDLPLFGLIYDVKSSSETS